MITFSYPDSPDSVHKPRLWSHLAILTHQTVSESPGIYSVHKSRLRSQLSWITWQCPHTTTVITVSYPESLGSVHKQRLWSQLIILSHQTVSINHNSHHSHPELLDSVHKPRLWYSYHESRDSVHKPLLWSQLSWITRQRSQATTVITVTLDVEQLISVGRQPSSVHWCSHHWLYFPIFSRFVTYVCVKSQLVVSSYTTLHHSDGF